MRIIRLNEKYDEGDSYYIVDDNKIEEICPDQVRDNNGQLATELCHGCDFDGTDDCHKECCQTTMAFCWWNGHNHQTTLLDDHIGEEEGQDITDTELGMEILADAEAIEWEKEQTGRTSGHGDKYWYFQSRWQGTIPGIQVYLKNPADDDEEIPVPEGTTW